jgi:hypothetical protein
MEHKIVRTQEQSLVLATASLLMLARAFQVHAMVAKVQRCSAMVEMVLPAVAVVTQEKLVTAVTAAQVQQVQQVWLARPDQSLPLAAQVETAVMAQ